MSTADYILRAHQAWLGYLQPDGLVVSASALADTQVVLDHASLAPLQQRLLPFVSQQSAESSERKVLSNVNEFLVGFLEWPTECLVGLSADQPIPETLCLPLSDFGETLTPTLALHDVDAAGEPAWLVLVQSIGADVDLDRAITREGGGWSASPARRFERLLRETRVPIGLLTNDAELRLMYAPRGENAGSLTFPVAAMTEVAGRPIVGALHMLLSRNRLLAGSKESRLPALLERSRAYQSAVSTALADQVLDALYELVRGLQVANEHSKGELLSEVLAKRPDDVYNGLLTVLLRLVFQLFAEDRGLMPGSTLYVRHYSVHGLFERLRADSERFPDTMGHRHGAWPQLLALFRTIYSGSRHPLLSIPARQGYLFDPTRYPFLEGTAGDLPRISDGVVFRVLRNLLILDGERLSYRTLDVEQIGSVYETMMGFRLEIASGLSIAVKPAKSGGAPAIVNLETLLEEDSGDRAKWLQDNAGAKPPAPAIEALKSARSTDDLLAALESRIARNATPLPLPKGALVLQPTDERRRSGSHYTPRSLTEPIVRTALRPILERLGEHPTAEQLQNLKVCDIAVGSGAFLVEACRQLGEELVASWQYHKNAPFIAPDEDELLHARRVVAQRCLYGVDRNPMAADLAKLSLWLVTLARDHPFTFLDHAVRWGDSLVGLTRAQLAAFHWESDAEPAFGQQVLDQKIDLATGVRREILETDDDFVSPLLKSQKLGKADEALEIIRLAGDAVIAAFFKGKKDRERQEQRDLLLGQYLEVLRTPTAAGPDEAVKTLKSGSSSINPFHWEIEFPEVFGRASGGFDAIVGNPPFMGGRKVRSNLGDAYCEWLPAVYDGFSNNADLVAAFFRRALQLLRVGGCCGLIATNSVSQGDTRRSGLAWMRKHDAWIYNCNRRRKWPGAAAVVISIVHFCKNAMLPAELDGRSVPIITAFLFHSGNDSDPSSLSENADKSYQGVVVAGSGFLFDDNNDEATPTAVLRSLAERQPRVFEIVRPYIGGEEINSSPTLEFSRWVIDFSDLDETAARQWPELMSIVEKRVLPYRLTVRREAHRKYWWRFGDTRPALRAKLAKLDRVLVNAQVSNTFAFVFQPTDRVFAMMLNVFTLDNYSEFCVLQCRIHELWARFFGSSMKDDLRYTPTDCFETFPFPNDPGRRSQLDGVGKEYYEYRSELMRASNAGLTATYNRFNDPNDESPQIARLRELHNTMDKAVLDAYGWSDILPSCEFISELESDETSGERAGGRRTRYRWPDDLRDEVLARLLRLNSERAVEEQLAGPRSATVLERGNARNATQSSDLFG